MKSLSDKVAIVTGGASGIGRAICIALSRRGALVIVADIRSSVAEDVRTSIVESGSRADSVRVDVSDEKQVHNLVNRVVRRHGRLDFIFNNAGIEMNGALLEIERKHWTRGFEINLNGVLLGSSAAYQVMIRQGFGHIVNTASLVGLIPLPGLPYYVAAKHAVVGFSLSLRAEAKPHGVSVSAACPGLVSTPIHENTGAILRRAPSSRGDLPWVERISPDECAEAILSGVERNRAIIATPRYAVTLWQLFRLFPTIFVACASRLYERSF